MNGVGTYRTEQKYSYDKLFQLTGVKRESSGGTGYGELKDPGGETYIIEGGWGLEGPGGGDGSGEIPGW